MGTENTENCEVCGKVSVLGVHGLSEGGTIESRYFCEKHANDFRRGKLNG